MIKPINNHILIEPIKQEGFMYQERTTYDEVGVVLDVPEEFPFMLPSKIIGQKVYFDSWLASKFPRGEGGDEYYWLVPFESVKAYESLPTE